TSTGEPDFRNAVGRFFKSRTTTLLLINLAVAALLSVLQPRFLDPDNLTSMFMGMTYDLLMAMGMTLVLILGGIDLSVGSVLALAGVVITMLLSNQVMSFPVPVPLAVLAGLVVAMTCGALNGLGVAKLKIAPFIVTLGMFAIARGLATVLTSGWYISGLPDAYLTIGQGAVSGIPFPILITLAILVVFNYLLKHWKPLNQAFYIGQNPDAAALSGIRVTLVTFFGYVISSTLAGVAAVFMTSRLAMGFFQFGLGSELNAIAGAVIGGASFAGGSGNLLGTFLGVLLLALIRNGFVLLNGSPNWQGVVSGAIVFLAIAVDAYRRRHETRE
ncbi:MAG: ABC transporter permease, partial [Caldilineaceae bacterium]|nr:ABC transporter permease [Caldilineaceae bacterium]